MKVSNQESIQMKAINSNSKETSTTSKSTTIKNLISKALTPQKFEDITLSRMEQCELKRKQRLEKLIKEEEERIKSLCRKKEINISKSRVQSSSRESKYTHCAICKNKDTKEEHYHSFNHSTIKKENKGLKRINMSLSLTRKPHWRARNICSNSKKIAKNYLSPYSKKKNFTVKEDNKKSVKIKLLEKKKVIKKFEIIDEKDDVFKIEFNDKIKKEDEIKIEDEFITPPKKEEREIKTPNAPKKELQEDQQEEELLGNPGKKLVFSSEEKTEYEEGNEEGVLEEENYKKNEESENESEDSDSEFVISLENLKTVNEHLESFRERRQRRTREERRNDSNKKIEVEKEDKNEIGDFNIEKNNFINLENLERKIHSKPPLAPKNPLNYIEEEEEGCLDLNFDYDFYREIKKKYQESIEKLRKESESEEIIFKVEPGETKDLEDFENKLKVLLDEKMREMKNSRENSPEMFKIKDRNKEDELNNFNFEEKIRKTKKKRGLRYVPKFEDYEESDTSGDYEYNPIDKEKTKKKRRRRNKNIQKIKEGKNKGIKPQKILGMGYEEYKNEYMKKLDFMISKLKLDTSYNQRKRGEEIERGTEPIFHKTLKSEREFKSDKGKVKNLINRYKKAFKPAKKSKRIIPFRSYVDDVEYVDYQISKIGKCC